MTLFLSFHCSISVINFIIFTNALHNCVACPVGQYQDDKGKTECKDCSKDRYGIERFETEGKKRKGATSNAECNEWYVVDIIVAIVVILF